MKKKQLHRFYNKTVNQRIETLIEENYIEDQSINNFKESFNLPEDIANHMIENQIATYQVPLGIGLHFLIDGNDYLVPMATEEPSVIAAASFADTTIRHARCYQRGQRQQ